MPDCNLIIDKNVNSAGLRCIKINKKIPNQKFYRESFLGTQKKPHSCLMEEVNIVVFFKNKGFQQFGQNHSPVSVLQS